MGVTGGGGSSNAVRDIPSCTVSLIQVGSPLTFTSSMKVAAMSGIFLFVMIMRVTRRSGQSW